MTKPIISIKLEGDDAVERVAKQLRYLLDKTKILKIYNNSLEYKTRAEKKREKYLRAVFINQKKLEMARKKRK